MLMLMNDPKHIEGLHAFTIPAFIRTLENASRIVAKAERQTSSRALMTHVRTSDRAEFGRLTVTFNGVRSIHGLDQVQPSANP